MNVFRFTRDSHVIRTYPIAEWGVAQGLSTVSESSDCSRETLEYASTLRKSFVACYS